MSAAPYEMFEGLKVPTERAPTTDSNCFYLECSGIHCCDCLYSFEHKEVLARSGKPTAKIVWSDEK